MHGGYELDWPDIFALTAERDVSRAFEATVDRLLDSCSESKRAELAKTTAKWFRGSVFEFLNKSSESVSSIESLPNDLAFIILEVTANRITVHKAKEVLDTTWSDDSKSLKEVYAESVTGIVSNATQLHEVAQKVIDKNENAVTDYKSGKAAAVGFLIGQVMKETHGNADPIKTRQVLKTLLD